MMHLIVLVTLYHVISSKRLLQQSTSITGTYGQTCLAPQSDFECQRSHMSITDQQQGSLECGVDYSCCLCESIICGSTAKWCDSFKVGAQYGAFGVQDIRVYGHPDTSGAVIDCGGPNACAGTSITGSWIDTLKCVGDGGCSGATVNVAMSRGIICSKEACVGGNFVMNSNIGGDINCGAERSCVGAVIEINGIENVKCNGQNACQNAKIIVNDPLEHFNLDCNGILACENLEVTLNIAEPTGGCIPGSFDVVEWKGITCGSNGGCEGLKFTVINNGCKMVRIEDLQCNPGRACSGAVFDFNAGTGLYGVDLQNCMCGPSCLDATGIDKCYNNVRTMECVDANACESQTRTITNPSNDFLLICASDSSCAQFELNLVIAGASQNLVRRLDGFDCGGIKSCQNANINIFNTQTTSTGAPVSLTIADIICSQADACNGAIFVTGGNVQIERVICIDGACDNCFIKETANSVGTPCIDGAVAPIIFESTRPSLPFLPDVPSIPSTPVVPSIPNGLNPYIPLDPIAPVDPVPAEPFTPIDPAPVVPQIPAVPSIPNIPAIPAMPSIPVIPANPVPVIPNIPANRGPFVPNPANFGNRVEIPPIV